MKTEIRTFMGLRPATNADLLAPGESTTALDVRLTNGKITPLLDLGASLITLSGAPQVTAIYRYGQSLVSDTQYWFQFNGDVDVVKGPINGDTEEKTYWTDGTYPKKTKSNLATVSPPYPTSSLRMGLPAPASAPTVAVTGVATNPNDPAEAVTFVMTYVSSWGEEGPPSPASTIVSWRAGQTLSLSALPTAPAGAYDVTLKRLYRSATGSSATQFQFHTGAGDIPVATTVYADTTLTANLGDVLATSGWIAPPDAMVGLCSMNGGCLAGFLGSTLYFSEPYVPSAWPARYQQSFPAPIVAICPFDQSLAVFTTQGIHVLTGTDPSNMSSQPLASVQTTSVKRSVVQIDGAVVFAGTDGVWKISSAGLENLTSTIFQTSDWLSILAQNISFAVEHDNRYILFLATGSLIFQFGQRPSYTTSSVTAYAGYRDRKKATLYLVDVANNVKKYEGGAALTWLWQSGSFWCEQAQNFACARVDANVYPVTFKFQDVLGTVRHTQTVADGESFRLPGGFRTIRYSFSLQGTSNIRAVTIATSEEEMTSG